MDEDQVRAGSAKSLDQGMIDQLATTVGTLLSINPEQEPSGETQTTPECMGTMPKKTKRSNSLPREDENEIEIGKLMGAGFDRDEAEGMQTFNRKKRER